MPFKSLSVLMVLTLITTACGRNEGLSFQPSMKAVKKSGSPVPTNTDSQADTPKSTATPAPAKGDEKTLIETLNNQKRSQSMDPVPLPVMPRPLAPLNSETPAPAPTATSTPSSAQTPAPAPTPTASSSPTSSPRQNDEKSSAEQLANASYSSAELKTILSHYTTGREFCEKFKSVTAPEVGSWITVPVDYQNPALGTTQIYAFFAEGKFDPSRPTAIFFDGGPGANSHGWSRLTEKFNELHFDQRGIGCSRPSTLELYRKDTFYSSLNTAKDADEVRKFFKIDRLSVFGGSYGTVPATIYANQFPEHTSAAVLIGVDFGTSTVGDSRVVSYSLKKMYEKFPQETKDAMLSYFDQPHMVSLFTLARMAMYGNEGLKKVELLLKEVFPAKDKIDTAKADKLFKQDLVTTAFYTHARPEKF